MGNSHKGGLSIELGFKPSPRYVLHSWNPLSFYKVEELNFPNFPQKALHRTHSKVLVVLR